MTTRQTVFTLGVFLSMGSSTARAAGDPSALWDRLGCAGCHGENGPYRSEIRGALGKPVDSVARWIRNAPSIKPDTMMPSFDGKIGEADSRALAEWVQARVAPGR